ncbi:MAG: hypothetical protein E7374_01990 [Clostridiales bacterium]|nr:hypothetical protein [Clostridiales bacterium]
MQKNEILLLNRMYQDATVGMLAIDKVLKKTKREDLKKLFQKQYSMYEKFASKCDAVAMSNDKEVKENSVFKKFKQSAMLYMSLWMDNSSRHIVEMMIAGTSMGIVDTIKAEKDMPVKNEELTEMVHEFKKIQEDFYEKLKKQLAKV